MMKPGKFVTYLALVSLALNFTWRLPSNYNKAIISRDLVCYIRVGFCKPCCHFASHRVNQPSFHNSK